jgi:Flp pilus assembly pilin Flp
MKRKALALFQALKSFWADESGQGMTEYASISTILILGSIAGATALPFVRQLFTGLQYYIDFYFFCLNIAVG